jgi:anti-sigma B factor antagonist
MELTFDRRRRHTAIICTGALDRMSAAGLKPAVAAALANAPLVVLNFKDVPEIDAMGLSAIVSGLRSARLAGGDLRVVDGTSTVRKALARTGLHRLLPVFGSIEEAVDAGRQHDAGRKERGALAAA